MESYKSDKNKYLTVFLPLFIFAGDGRGSRIEEILEHQKTCALELSENLQRDNDKWKSSFLYIGF